MPRARDREEDEVAWGKLIARNVRAIAVVRRGVVGERNPQLREDVHHEARAVEAGRRARAAPDVRDAEVLQRDPNDAAVARSGEVRVVGRLSTRWTRRGRASCWRPAAAVEGRLLRGRRPGRACAASAAWRRCLRGRICVISSFTDSSTRFAGDVARSSCFCAARSATILACSSWAAEGWRAASRPPCGTA